MVTWLPTCRSRTNPALRRALTVFVPEITGSLGNADPLLFVDSHAVDDRVRGVAHLNREGVGVGGDRVAMLFERHSQPIPTDVPLANLAPLREHRESLRGVNLIPACG